MNEDPFQALRHMMAEIILAHIEATRELTQVESLDQRMLDAMIRVPREEFVPAEMRAYAHADGPLPIGFDKTISQPFITALMTGLLDPREDERVLEIGTGLGYHTAVLSELAGQVYSVEIIGGLLDQARERLGAQGINNVETRLGNGRLGWPEFAPFDKIILAASAELMPPELLNQLKPGGRMVLPTGIEGAQQLMLVDKDMDGRISTREVLGVRFALLEEC